MEMCLRLKNGLRLCQIEDSSSAPQITLTCTGGGGVTKIIPGHIRPMTSIDLMVMKLVKVKYVV